MVNVKRTIKRSSDKVVFTFGCTRNNYLESTSPSDVLVMLDEAADLQGEFAYIQRHANGTLMATTSFEQGIPIGESIRSAFPEEPNIIWCESVDIEKGGSLLVIISDGLVLVDNFVPVDTVDRTSLLALSDSTRPYKIFVYGDVPLCVEGDEDSFTPNKMPIPKKLVARFVRLEEPILPTLPANDELLLLPIAEAAEKAHIASNFWRNAIVASLLIGLIFLGFTLTEEEEVIHPETQVVVDPFQSYRDSMASQSPAELLWSNFNSINQAVRISGWSVTKLVWTDGVTEMDLIAEGGSFEVAKNQLANTGWSTSVISNGLVAKKNLDLPYREETTTIPENVQASIAKIQDELSLVNGKLSTEAAVFDGAVYMAPVYIEVKFEGVRDFTYIAEILNGMHAKLNTLRFEREKSGTTHAFINVTLYGLRSF